MLRECARVSVITTLALLSFVITADAQSRAPAPPVPKEFPTRPGNGSSFRDTNGAVKPITTGWNFVHAANCTVYLANGAYYLFVYFVEGGSLYTAVPEFKDLINPACQTGNLIAFYVIDTAGDWNQIYTYTFP